MVGADRQCHHGPVAHPIDADYLVVGAGAMGMAFTDALVEHAGVHVPERQRNRALKRRDRARRVVASRDAAGRMATGTRMLQLRIGPGADRGMQA